MHRNAPLKRTRSPRPRVRTRGVLGVVFTLVRDYYRQRAPRHGNSSRPAWSSSRQSFVFRDSRPQATTHYLQPMSAVSTTIPGLAHNWMGNVTLMHSVAAAPTCIEDLQRCVSAAVPPVRIVGSGHSFTPLCSCDGSGTLISMRNLRRVWDFCTTDGSCSIKCEGGASRNNAMLKIVHRSRTRIMITAVMPCLIVYNLIGLQVQPSPMLFSL